MPVQLVIFDIAGTLIEDHDEVTSAFLAAFLENGIQVTREELREWKGAAKRAVIRRFVGQNDPKIEKTFAGFRRILEHSYVQTLTPISGAQAAIEILRDAGVKTATNTGFYRELRDAIVDRLGWRELFDAHVCSDDVAHGRPAPEMIFHAMQITGVTNAAAVMAVGDTPLDLQAAKNAGAVGVGVLTGVHRRERLEREPHAHIVSSVREVPALCLASLSPAP